MILAGDIGGTKTNLAWFDWRDGRLECLEKATFASQAFPGLEPILSTFLAASPGEVTAACFGMAGPVVSQRCETTNLPWVVDRESLSVHLATPRVRLLNDLESTGYGIPVLKPEHVVTLQAGVEQVGNQALIAAGTGLGESFLFWNGTQHVPCPSEGGHSDFGPRNEWEIDLLRFLAARYRHVSYERILSGPGFFSLFEFICSRGAKPLPEVAAAVATARDPTPIISRAGVNRTCEVCAEVVDRFVEVYGAEAGNMALKGLAVAGVYIGGGIAPKIAPRLIAGTFLRAFQDKGRFDPLLERIPVRLILDPETALWGAARFASML